LTVLVVEDEPLVRLISAEFLRSGDYHVLESATVAEALTVLASSDEIRLMFSDILLPGTTGGLSLAEWSTSIVQACR
jgi:two-component system, response regulator PdtaR